MTSYLSSLLTHTTSRYNNLRRSLLSDENDGDTEEDSHISRVLRAYYVEKGRPFPPWLGPDPSASQSSSSLYSSQPAMRQQSQSASARRGGGLSDLWDSPAQQAQPSQPTSLRRGVSGASGRTASPAPPPTATAAPNPGPRDRFNTSEAYASRPSRPQPSGARPMAGSQQAGYQGLPPATDPARSSAPGSSLGSGPGSVSGGTAQDRLKAKLWGAGRAGATRDPL